MPLAQPTRDDLLRRVGLLPREGGVPADPPPCIAVSMLSSCRPQDGRRDAWVDHRAGETVPGRVERADSGWFTLASGHGLFGPGREFLLGVPGGERTREWRRVRLAAEWDLMGAGAESGLLGSAAARPEFVTASLDGRGVVQGAADECVLGGIVVHDLRREPTVRTRRERIVGAAAQPHRADLPEEYHRWAAEWLRYARCHQGRPRPAGPVPPAAPGRPRLG